MENETYWDIAARFEDECLKREAKINSSSYPTNPSIAPVKKEEYREDNHRKMKKVTFELPDNTAAISMAIVTSECMGAILITKSYGGKELDDGAVNEWTEPEYREVGL